MSWKSEGKCTSREIWDYNQTVPISMQLLQTHATIRSGQLLKKKEKLISCLRNPSQFYRYLQQWIKSLIDNFCVFDTIRDNSSSMARASTSRTTRSYAFFSLYHNKGQDTMCFCLWLGRSHPKGSTCTEKINLWEVLSFCWLRSVSWEKQYSTRTVWHIYHLDGLLLLLTAHLSQLLLPFYVSSFCFKQQ